MTKFIKKLPCNLDELVYEILLSPGPLDRMKFGTKLLIKDYLTVKFGAAMMNHPEVSDILETLFKSCTEMKGDK